MGSHRRRLAVAAGVVAGHLLVLATLLFQTYPQAAAEPPAMAVALVDLRPQAAATKPASPMPLAAVEPPPPRNVMRPTPVRVRVETVLASEGPTGAGTAEMSDAELGSAATAGSGGGGCDMARWLQSALRKDARVQAAVATAHGGKAVRVWNGDWIRDGAQDGNGLAAVREAIMWEVAFAPPACRAEPVHGLVLISMTDGPGASRLVVGSGDWRWSDLLHPKR